MLLTFGSKAVGASEGEAVLSAARRLRVMPPTDVKLPPV